jgi:hypothetical protein
LPNGDAFAHEKNEKEKRWDDIRHSSAGTLGGLPALDIRQLRSIASRSLSEHLRDDEDHECAEKSAAGEQVND